MSKYAEQLTDRAEGLVVGGAYGDALGSAYEFQESHESDWIPEFSVGVFGHERGEWTDDTAMAIPLLEWVAAAGQLPTRYILERWLQWAEHAKDVGVQTRKVLNKLKVNYANLESAATLEAYNVHVFSRVSAGNGALMRVGPYALHELTKPLDVLTLAKMTRWTHYEDDNVKAVVFWVTALRSALLEGSFSPAETLERSGLIADERWRQFIEEATRPQARASDYKMSNGWVVGALQGALASLSATDSFEEALFEAVRAGGDTDTVAAITGYLAGALYGFSSIPSEPLKLLHGWPEFTVDSLRELARKSIATAI